MSDFNKENDTVRELYYATINNAEAYERYVLPALRMNKRGLLSDKMVRHYISKAISLTSGRYVMDHCETGCCVSHIFPTVDQKTALNYLEHYYTKIHEL